MVSPLPRYALLAPVAVMCALSACGSSASGADDSGVADAPMTRPSSDGAMEPSSDGGGVSPGRDAAGSVDGGHDAGSDGGISRDSGADGAAANVGIHASGNKLVNGAGQTISLHGVDLNGTEYMCAQGAGIFDSPITTQSATAMASWDIKAVRIGLNEDCWLAIHGADPAYSGANYQTPFENAVSLLTTAGMVVIVELHWSSTGSALALGQEPMPTATSLMMWQQVAAAFKDNGSVVFDLYNEPILLQGLTDKAGNTYAAVPASEAWDCWENGQSATNACGGFPAAGMQSIVSAVRAAGANNLIMLGGLNYSNDLTEWPAHVPTDPAKNLAASFHGYGDGSNEYFVVGAQSSTPTANVNSMLGAVLTAGYPVVIGEFGSSASGSGAFDQTDMTSLMTWADTNNVSYLAFSWVHYGIALVDLITDYTSFAATSQWGTFYQSWLKTH